MLQYSASKLMTTLMVSGADRTRNLQDLVFMVHREGFGAGVVSVLRACVFLEMLLDLPHDRTWKMGPNKHMEEFDPIFFQGTFNFRKHSISSFRKHSTIDSPKAISPEF